MHIVSDRGMDLPPELLEGLTIHLAPLLIGLDGKTYVSGVDIQPEEFYALLPQAQNLPTTSLPSPGEFAQIFRELAKTDPEILYVHISSGLSSTYNSAREGAKLVPEARVTFFDTLTLSAAEGWQVEAAARAAKAGWPMEQVLELLTKVREATDTISHIKGLLASVLNIKPIIGVSKVDGKYYQRGQARTFPKALAKLVDVVAEQHGEGTPLRIQIMHTNNLAGVREVKALFDARFPVTWLSPGVVAPVLGAHTGLGLVGLAYAPLSAYPALP